MPGGFANCHPRGRGVKRRQENLRVNNIFQAWRRGCRGAGKVLLLAGFVVGLPRTTAAHDLFTAFIQHSARLTVGARHVDLTVDLTFFEEWSARERLAMDTDGDGRITRAELDAYLKNVAPELSKQVKLRVAGRELSLAPLYDPEADLLGNDKAIPGHHRLRLFFFAPTPATLRAGNQFVIEDRLWPEAKMLATAAAEGRDGAALEAGQPGDAGFAALRPGEALLFKVQCVKPPAPNPAALNLSVANSTRLASKPLPLGPHTHQQNQNAP